MQTPASRSESNAKYYQANRTKVGLLNKLNKQRNMEYIAKVKLDKGCQQCGYRKCAAALDFHHIESKSFEVSRGANNGKSIEVLDAEIAKCIVLCANCHRELHASVG